MNPNTTFVTEYTVNALGRDAENEDWPLWCLVVSWREEPDRWAVCWASRCLGADGTWDYERSPSNRGEEWKRTHRFPLEEALRLAEKMVWKLRINGSTAADGIYRHYPELIERIPVEHRRT